MLYLLYRLKYLYAPYLPLRAPVDVSMELASACDMRCGYCYHADQNNLPFKRGFMKEDVAEKIILQAWDLGVNSLKFNWKGESTLNPIFPYVTELAMRLASGMTFIDRITNSNFNFDTKRDDIFEGLCNQTKVKISYDSFKKEVFEAQRIKGNHDVVTDNIDKFYHHPKRKNTEVVIQSVRTALNKDEPIDELARRRWPNAKISIRDMVGGRRQTEYDELEIRSRDTSQRQSCIQAHSRLLFNHEGKVYPCCPDTKEQLEIGDINTQSMYEIWNGQAAKQLRAQLKNKKAFESDPCKSCSSYETYKGFKPSFVS